MPAALILPVRRSNDIFCTGVAIDPQSAVKEHSDTKEDGRKMGPMC
jgi:hypothetical protein